MWIECLQPVSVHHTHNLTTIAMPQSLLVLVLVPFVLAAVRDVWSNALCTVVASQQYTSHAFGHDLLLSFCDSKPPSCLFCLVHMLTIKSILRPKGKVIFKQVPTLPINFKGLKFAFSWQD